MQPPIVVYSTPPTRPIRRMCCTPCWPGAENTPSASIPEARAASTSSSCRSPFAAGRCAARHRARWRCAPRVAATSLGAGGRANGSRHDARIWSGRTVALCRRARCRRRLWRECFAAGPFDAVRFLELSHAGVPIGDLAASEHTALGFAPVTGGSCLRRGLFLMLADCVWICEMSAGLEPPPMPPFSCSSRPTATASGSGCCTSAGSPDRHQVLGGNRLHFRGSGRETAQSLPRSIRPRGPWTEPIARRRSANLAARLADTGRPYRVSRDGA
jgi:hypothetical protein